MFFSRGRLNGIAIWHEIIYEENDKLTKSIDTGLVKPPIFGKILQWSYQYKQAVHLLDQKYVIDKEPIRLHIPYSISFDVKNGVFDCNFKIDTNFQ